MRSYLKLTLPIAIAVLSAGAMADQDDASKPPKEAAATPKPAKGKDGKSKDQKKTDDPKGKDSKDSASKDKKDKGKDPGKKDKDPDKVSKNDKTKMSLPLVAGQPSKGLKIPYYDGNGKLQMTFVIGEASRLDDSHVQMAEMRVQSYDDKGQPDLDIDLPTSVLDMDAHILTSHARTTIKREDFKISGDSVEFNTDTKESHLVGNVHMTIYNLNDTAAPKNDETQAGAKAHE